MFDISFAELLIIAVVALLVIGPEKLPKVARTMGAFAGRLQRYVSQIKEEVNREVRFEALQNLQQEINQGVHQVESNIMAGARAVDQSLQSAKDTVKPKRKTDATKSSTQKEPIKISVNKKRVIKKTSAKKPSVSKPSAKKVIVKQSVDKVQP